MIHNIFYQKRPKRDYVLFLLAIPAVCLTVIFSDFSHLKRISPDINEFLNAVSDSIVEARAYNRDTLLIQRMLTRDDLMIRSISKTLGVYNARNFFDSSAANDFAYTISFVRQRSRTFNFNFNSGAVNSRSADRGSSGTNRLLQVWCDKHGRIIGSSEPQAGVFILSDTTEILKQLCAYAPQHLVNGVRQWHHIDSVESEVQFSGLYEENRYFTRDVFLRAYKLNNSSWRAEWQLESNIKPAYAAPEEGDNPLAPYTSTMVFVVFISLVIGFIVVFITRLLKKAVNLILCLAVSVLVASYMMLTAASVLEFSFFNFVVIALVQLVFIGFLLAGMPIAGLISLARETFAAKFYTALRILRRPLQSHYLGRSLLAGISMGSIAAAFVPVFFYLAYSAGSDEMFTDMVFNGQLRTLMVFEPIAIALSIFMAVPIVISGILFTPVITYRYFRKGIRTVLALAGSIFLSVLFSSLQVDNIPYALVYGLVMGGLGFYVFYFYDMVAIVTFGAITTIVGFLPLFVDHTGITVLYALLLGCPLVLGLLTYRLPPESVGEEDYKPNFVYKLEEERRIQQELEAAKSVQQRLLPATVPTFPRVDLAASCVPAFEVGGDYYDFFSLDEHRLGLLIGDVSGKGMSAAFYITLAKGVIVSQIRQVGTPSEILHRVNALLYGVMERGRFISMIYAVLDTRSNEFAYANAGHNPLIHRQAATGKAQIVPSKGMAIGLDAGNIFAKAVTTHTLKLEENDIVVFYTDGVTEAMNRSVEEYSEERLLHCIEEAQPTPSDTVSSVLSSVNHFVGRAKQHDDITVVALQVRGEGLYSESKRLAG